MRFGLFLQPVHPPTEDPTNALERDLDLIVQLDKLGYAEAWIGEHHSTGWENIGSPEVFIAVAAERTRHIQFGTGVVQVGLHHPLALLDRLILLDHLTRGRVMWGFGVGGGVPSDLALHNTGPLPKPVHRHGHIPARGSGGTVDVAVRNSETVHERRSRVNAMPVRAEASAVIAVTESPIAEAAFRVGERLASCTSITMLHHESRRAG